MFKRTIGMLIILMVVGVVIAQENITKTPPPEEPKKDCPSKEACKLWEEFKEKYGSGWQVRWNKHTGTPEKIYGYHYDMGMGEVTSESKAVSIAKEIIENNEILLKAVSSELKLERIQNDSSGWIIDYRQLYNSVPVYNGEVRVLLTNKGELNGILNNFYPNISLSTTPTISESEAIEIAKSAVNVSTITKLENVSLTILPQKGDGEFKYLLVWIVSLRSYSVIDGSEGFVDAYKVFVDAQSGEVIKKYSTVVSATDDTGNMIRYNSKLLLAPAILVFLLIIVYLWRRWRK